MKRAKVRSPKEYPVLKNNAFVPEPSSKKIGVKKRHRRETLRRATLKVSGADVELDEIPVPEPPPKGVVVKTKFCGVCHSDAHLLELAVDRKEDPNHEFSFSMPWTLGHEIAGEVYKLGRDVESDLKIGDDVFVYPWIGCLDCDDCRNDRTEKCKTKKNVIGWNVGGGFGSHVVVADSKFAVKALPSITLHHGGLLTCSGLTTFSAVSKIKPHFEGKQGTHYLLVIGTGGLGLFCLQFAKALLPENTRIIAADIEKSKLETALDHGADDVIWWDRSKTPNETPEDDDDFVRQMKEKSNGGFHGIIDIVNTGSTVSRCFKCMRVGGAMALIGLFGGNLNLDLRDFVELAPTVYGIKVGSFTTFLKLLEFVSEHPIKYPPCLFYKLEELQMVVNMVNDRKIIGRGVLQYD